MSEFATNRVKNLYFDALKTGKCPNCGSTKKQRANVPHDYMLVEGQIEAVNLLAETSVWNIGEYMGTRKSTAGYFCHLCFETGCRKKLLAYMESEKRVIVMKAYGGTRFSKQLMSLNNEIIDIVNGNKPIEMKEVQ